ncbi:hypothetical protein BN179_1100001 [Clostridioides difficile T6]|nr:hypothetical protein BN178_940002 [Clostridioides difficile T42]CCL48146.1 hypothetical protein BN179_1100001 [Clostridioides difficile T6]DAG69512.1 MAG TPA: hypothetical protein [Caudoviricetes sp.]
MFAQMLLNTQTLAFTYHLVNINQTNAQFEKMPFTLFTYHLVNIKRVNAVP